MLEVYEIKKERYFFEFTSLKVGTKPGVGHGLGHGLGHGVGHGVGHGLPVVR